ncbi:DUF3817 domain-containing protein [Cellulomonas sp. PhB143]|uniref:DUF3817 domain-containing protein n=1 Tax=Cellulomonas sp. PhB143 TaxID=2485186 RepID=UPI000F4ACA7D|nr:DUF3817 domain-containing protein [Cellulomonas sp. PhB143]ROS73602.1 integral membrane protein [Cellulomonas sp. PhB143]
MARTPLSLFRALALAEAASWTLLIVGMILRATAGLDVAVSIGGGIHGFVFLCYGLTVVLVAKNQRWRAGPTTVALVSAVVPYASVPTEIWLHRTGRLDGDWRRAAGDDPRDATWHDRLLRTLLSSPWRSAGSLAVAVVAVFVVLLAVGPPGGRG